MATKNQILETIQSLPDSVTTDEVIERIVLLQKIDKGLQQSNSGDTVSTKDAKLRMEKWLK